MLARWNLIGPAKRKKRRNSRLPAAFPLAALALFLAAMLIASCNQNGDAQNARLNDSSSNPTPYVPTVSDIAKVRFITIPEGMALVPAGLAVYGCDPGTDDACGPYDIAMTVAYNEPFLIDKTEVAFGGYRACVEAGGCASNDCLPEPGGDEDAYPAACVAYAEAETYCAWAGKRMPTDWEWERAARGIAGSLYPWGNEWCPECLNWTDDGAFDGSIDSYAGAAPVDSFPAGKTSYGALNMSGNVWELTRGDLPGENGEQQVVLARGGGYSYPEGSEEIYNVMAFYRTTFRAPVLLEDYSAPFIGFRCAEDPEYE